LKDTGDVEELTKNGSANRWRCRFGKDRLPNQQQ
jgi:hypothetical protein